MPVRILIADDHEGVREGVRAIINRARPEWEICGEATNGRDAVHAAEKLNPDVILLDINMPGTSGLEAASQISRLGLKSPILIFTMLESGELSSETRRAGASGYVKKSEAVRDLVLAVETLLSGGTFFGHPEEAPQKPRKGPGTGIQYRLALVFP